MKGKDEYLFGALWNLSLDSDFFCYLEDRKVKQDSIEEILEYLKFQGNVRCDDFRQPILATYRFLMSRLHEEVLWELPPVEPGKPNGYYFMVEDDEQMLFGIVEKSFWDKNHYLSDESFGLNPPPNLPKQFDEVAESIFQCSGSDIWTARAALIEAGFVEVG